MIQLTKYHVMIDRILKKVVSSSSMVQTGRSSACCQERAEVSEAAISPWKLEQDARAYSEQPRTYIRRQAQKDILSERTG